MTANDFPGAGAEPTVLTQFERVDRLGKYTAPDLSLVLAIGNIGSGKLGRGKGYGYDKPNHAGEGRVVLKGVPKDGEGISPDCRTRRTPGLRSVEDSLVFPLLQ